jgi:ribonuclease I
VPYKGFFSQADAEAEAAVAELQSKVDPLTEELQTVSIKPKKTNISVQLVALVWAPHWCDAQGTATPAWI